MMRAGAAKTIGSLLCCGQFGGLLKGRETALLNDELGHSHSTGDVKWVGSIISQDNVDGSIIVCIY
eukprot:9526219-Ditylum_brightwellii.AAC.1